MLRVVLVENCKIEIEKLKGYCKATKLDLEIIVFLDMFEASLFLSRNHIDLIFLNITVPNALDFVLKEADNRIKNYTLIIISKSKDIFLNSNFSKKDFQFLSKPFKYVDVYSKLLTGFDKFVL